MNKPSRPSQPSQPRASFFWADLKSTDFAALDLARTVAVLPVGATEQHGPHLPLSVDTDLVDAVVHQCVSHLSTEDAVLLLPTQAVGKSNEHERFAGTLSFSTETLLRVWMDIGASVARAGIKKLLIFNAHGGHASAMDLVARDLRVAHQMMVFHTSWYQLPLGSAGEQFSADEWRFGVHAGEVETAMMLAIKADSVDMSQAQNFDSSSRHRALRYPILGNGKSVKWGWQMQDYNPAGAAGNAAQADAAKGQALIDQAGLQLAALLRELQAVPLSTLAE
jgi:creatinine amidohydrolase